jgi:hypothetical protein
MTAAEKKLDRRAAHDEYRQWLVQAEQKAQDDYDKTVLALSGGALGISFAFVKDIIGERPIEQSWLLVGSWLAWAASAMAMLASYYFSRKALRKAIEQCDDNSIDDCDTPGGIFTKILRQLNVCGALLFLVGVCLMAFFVEINITSREVPSVGKETIQQSTKATAPAVSRPDQGEKPWCQDTHT